MTTVEFGTPVAYTDSRSRLPGRCMSRGRARVRFVLFTVVTTALAASGQDPTKPAKDKDAIRLPDGTIVFYTKSPDDPNPPIDGVRLSAKEYKSLVDQAEQLKKLKDGAKPVGP